MLIGACSPREGGTELRPSAASQQVVAEFMETSPRSHLPQRSCCSSLNTPPAWSGHGPASPSFMTHLKWSFTASSLRLTKNHGGGKQNRTQEEAADLSEGRGDWLLYGAAESKLQKIESTPRFNPFHPPRDPRKLIKSPFLGDWIPLAERQAALFCCWGAGAGGAGERGTAITDGGWGGNENPVPLCLLQGRWVVNTAAAARAGGWAGLPSWHSPLRAVHGFEFFHLLRAPLGSLRGVVLNATGTNVPKNCVWWVVWFFFLSLKRVVVLLCQCLEAGTACSFCLK